MPAPMAPPRRNRASPWAIVLAATLLAAGLATVAAGRALRVDPVKTSDPDALQPVSLDPQGQKHPYAWEELTWVANGAAAAQQAQRSPAAAAPAPAAAVSDGSDFGVVRCDMVVHVTTQYLPFESVMVGMRTYWKAVVMGRRLFVRGFWTYEEVEDPKVQAMAYQTEGESWTFFLRSAHHPTLALRLPVTTLDTTASKARNGDKSNAAGRPPVRAVRAMLDLPEDFDAEGLQEWMVVQEGSDDACAVTASPLGMQDQELTDEALPGWLQSVSELRSRFTPGPAPESPRVTIASQPEWKSTDELMAPLLWNMRWHEAFGVTDHIVYVNHDAKALADDTRVKELTAAGRLRLIDLKVQEPGAAGGLLAPDSDLWLRHVLLAAWPQSYLLALADPDELLFTPQPTTLVQLMETCDTATQAYDVPRQPLAVLAPQLTPVWCVEGCDGPADASKAKSEDAATDAVDEAAAPWELQLWLGANEPTSDLQGPTEGTARDHPLRHYAMAPIKGLHGLRASGAVDDGTFADFVAPKPILRPGIVNFGDLHTPSAMPHTRTAVVERGGCAGWFHAVNLHPRRRALGAGPFPGVPEEQQGQYKIPEGLMWPMRQ